MKRHFDALLSNAIFAILGLLSFIILSRGVAPVVFGSWVLFLSISTFLDLIRFGLTRNAIIQIMAGESHENSRIINAAGLRIGINILVVISAILLSLWGVGRNIFPDSYLTILLWYPLVGVSNLLWNNGLTWLQGRSRFQHITLLRFVNIASFVLFVLMLLHYNAATINHIIIAYIASNTLSSLLSLTMGWDSFRLIGKSPKSLDSQILNFGKYSTVSNIGSSLLKSADSFIIGLSPVLGVTGIAIYAIPFKVVEMLELPIRSISMVGFNELSTSFRIKAGNMRQLLAKYAVIMSLLTLPMIAFIAIFPDFVLDILGGKQYMPHFAEMRTMLYMLLVYGIMLIPDRLTGIALEAAGKPHLNTLKVSLMAIANIVGDLIAVLYFQSLIGVIFATVSFVVIGVTVGYRLIDISNRPTINDISTELHKITHQWKAFLLKKGV